MTSVVLVLSACFSGNDVFACAVTAAFCLPMSQRPLCSPGGTLVGLVPMDEHGSAC